jgi:hypothetical protein
MPSSAQPPSVDRTEVLALADRARRGELSPADGSLVVALLAQLVSPTDQLREKNASIRRLRRVAFGPSSERRPRGVAGAEQHPVSSSSDAGSGDERPKRRGRGRTRASGYTSTRRVQVGGCFAECTTRYAPIADTVG